MGNNRRHPDGILHDLARFDADLRAHGTPTSLTEQELAATGPRQDPPRPVPVTAWVPHHVAYDTALHITGEAIAWTDKAVLVHWRRPDGGPDHHTWVWAGAVTRL